MLCSVSPAAGVWLFCCCVLWQAGLGQFAEVSGFFWVGCIAFNIYGIAVLRMNDRQLNLQHKRVVIQGAIIIASLVCDCE